MRYGADYLGGKHFESAMLRTHPVGWAGGIFLRTFGDASNTVIKMGQSGKFSEIVVHLAAFDNSHAYPVSKLKSQLLKDARWLESVSRKFPSVVFLLSPFCEHNHPRSVMEPLFRDLKSAAPSCLMLNSIWKGQQVPGVITEIHLSNSRLPKKPQGEYTVSFDGFGGDGSGDFTDTDIQKILNYFADARHVRLWNFRYNGKFGHKDSTPLGQRKNWPDSSYLTGHNRMMKNREGAITWGKNELYKPFADDHGQGGKDNRAMAIVQTNKNSIDVFDSNGNKIDTMYRVSPDHVGNPKGPRYYSKLYAYQIADKAQQNTGSRLIRIASRPLTDGDLRSGLMR